MKRRTFINRSSIMLGVALLAGLAAAWAARQHIQGRVDFLESQARVVEVERVVAAHPLPAGTRLSLDDMAVRRFPAQLVSSESMVPSRYPELEGQTLRSSLAAGDMIFPVHIQGQHAFAFSTRVASGRRAITMTVNAINSVSGLLEPGDLIDLYVSFEYQRRRITAPLLQGVAVLATGRSTEALIEGDGLHSADPSGHYNTITLDASPEDAIKLVAAREAGVITAVLRNPQDDQASNKASRGDLASLLGLNTQPPVSRPKTVPVLYGNTTIRRVPSLTPTPTASRAPLGVFELPYQPQLSSVGRQSLVQAMPHGLVQDDFPIRAHDVIEIPNGLPGGASEQQP